MSSSGPGQGSRVARAATRYRPGKAPINADGAYSSDDSDEDEDERKKRERRRREQQQYDQPITDLSSGTAALKNAQRRTAGVIIQSGGAATKPVVKLDNVTIGGKRRAVEEEDDESDEYETDTDDEGPAPSGPSKPIFKKPGSAAPIRKQESSEYETDSEEEESEEDNRPVMLKPIFVSKKQRETLKVTGADEAQVDGGSKTMATANIDEMDAETRKAKALAEERRKQSHLLAAETIKRELAEKDHEDGQPDLSDTDGKDPEEEFQAWRIRELSRLKAEKELSSMKEAERMEIERRRAMPESQRLAEDMERAQKSRDEKKRERSQQESGTFMQKYHHKGSFFQDMDILKNRDYSAKTESAVDMSLLPKVMQVRDYGKAGRSKWTHLSNEDTSRKQQDHRMKGISGMDGARQGASSSSGQQCFACGGPHLRRDCPEVNGNGGGGGREGRGANSVPLRSRRSRSPDRRRQQDTSSRRER